MTSKITASSKRCRTSIPQRVPRATALLCPLRSHAVAFSPTGLLCPRPAHYFLYLLSFHSARVPHVLGLFSSPEISLVSVLFRSMVSCIKLRALDAERKKMPDLVRVNPYVALRSWCCVEPCVFFSHSFNQIYLKSALWFWVQVVLSYSCSSCSKDISQMQFN